MRVVLSAAALIVISALSGCATARDANEPAGLEVALADAQSRGLRVVSGAELRRLVVGRRLVPADRWGSSRSPRLSEALLPHGRFTALARALRLEGTYHINRNSLCFDANSLPEYCYVLAVDEEDHYFRVLLNTGYGPEGILIEIL